MKIIKFELIVDKVYERMKNKHPGLTRKMVKTTIRVGIKTMIHHMFYKHRIWMTGFFIMTAHKLSFLKELTERNKKHD